MQKKESPFTDELKVQGIVIAGLHWETQQYIASEHVRTRAEIVQAINSLKDWGTTTTDRRDSSGPVDRAAEHRHLVENSILNSLTFPTMNSRYQGIDDAHAKTFDWIFQPPKSKTRPWSDFSEWLLSGDGIYWINGKAGSGKSTLMRYICEDDRTQSLLKKWASSTGNLLTASFFFWKSGSSEQASQFGLLCSLLFTLLEQRRELIQSVFPGEWRLFEQVSHTQESPPTWTARQLRTGLTRFFQLDLGTRVCIFVDGLDEYDGDPAHTIQLFKSISSSNVKICLSSRPWVEFDDAFKNMPSLRLQDLTFDDIQLYIDDTLATDERMVVFSKECPSKALAFTREIISKAHGVFLWVKLVVRSLLNGLLNGDRVEELEQRLEELPSDLRSLYAFMFGAISPRYLTEGAKIFQMMYAMQDLKFLAVANDGARELSAVALSFALENEEAIHIPMKTLTAPEVARRVRIADKRLKVCCAGLLELSGNARWEFGYLGHCYEFAPESKVAHQRVDFIHRTAKDFLDTIRDSLLQLTLGTNFNAYTSLFRSCIIQLKTYYPLPACAGDFETLLSKPMALAHFAEKEQHKPTIELIDEFAKVLSLIRPNLMEPSHRKMLEENWPMDFLVIAVRSSLFSYLTRKFNLPSQIPKSPCGHSYLYYALKKSSIKRVIISEETIQFLLKYSSREDIAEGWKTLLNFIFDRVIESDSIQRGQKAEVHDAHLLLATMRLFLEYGADPNDQKMDANKERVIAVRDFVNVLDNGSDDEAAKIRALLSPSIGQEVAKGYTSPRNWLKQFNLLSHRKSSNNMRAKRGK